MLNSILPRANRLGDRLNDYNPWHEISNLNAMLECYSHITPRVEFFNATSLFIRVVQGHEVQNGELFQDPVHPNAAGSEIWGRAIVRKVLELAELG